MKSSRKPVVVVVAMLDSIHVARWLNIVKDLDYVFVLFPSSPHRRIHSGVKRLLSDPPTRMQFHLSRHMRVFSLVFWILDRFLDNQIRAKLLKKLVIKSKASIVHAIEFQNSGYLARRACEDLQIPLYVTNWGSDIYWFQKFPKHRQEIRSLLERSDYYSSECLRDQSLASEYGFKGTFFPVVPNAGGLNLDMLSAFNPTKTSSRKKIMIKGYTNFVGRADLAIESLVLLKNELRNYEIVVYSATYKARLLSFAIRHKHKIDIRCIPKKHASHEQILSLFQESRIYVGISQSDGISTSMLEAISMGCFPIQTSTSCANEWMNDNQSGILISLPTSDSIATAIKESLLNDALVDSAQTANSQTARERLDIARINPIVQTFYPLILQDTKSSS
jgi:glycosyltransferase involved in cell wall biosynthesis